MRWTPEPTSGDALIVPHEISATAADLYAVERCTVSLCGAPDSYGAAPLAPHPLAAHLALPNGRPAPAAIRLWAALDNYYPLHGSRSETIIADGRGVILAEPMEAVLRRVCLESIMDEIEDDEGTRDYLSGLVSGFAREFPGYGVVLAEECPDPLLWIPPAGEPTLLWYDRDAFARRQAFAQAVAEAQAAADE
ncbi:hypothetical protein ACF064_35355 [Streptomyces sp. NPDC015492]|uniref:hypothetical protein n=1 Tax=Streptomyces sp. NPDC015492 TaxID=3364958 RepID=UPI003702902B